ncbi:hypothetical protein [Deinococcus marmoris]|uniref:Uncharacterized protein n=1 Tax=Deinococcus marmoris TaxID=249408 RepID=A0A1U7P4V4_9DEIO|nr:hypothetical protein [Deinococcus marmoris]OLV20188.1 hypothetical protein BOO71_0000592 [Deinococcus marmoris]
MNAHLPTLLAAVSLGLSGLNGGPPLPPPLDRPNLLRLRDVLETASILPETPLILTPSDHEALLVCVLTTDAYLDSGRTIDGPPDLLRALEEEQRQGAREALMNELDVWKTLKCYGTAHAQL